MLLKRVVLAKLSVMIALVACLEKSLSLLFCKYGCTSELRGMLQAATINKYIHPTAMWHLVRIMLRTPIVRTDGFLVDRCRQLNLFYKQLDCNLGVAYIHGKVVHVDMKKPNHN